MEQRTEVAVATELSLVKRALGVVVLLGGMMLFSWFMAGTAHADAPDRPGQAERGRGAGLGLGIAAEKSSAAKGSSSEQASSPSASQPRAPEKSVPREAQPEEQAARPTAPVERQVAETGQQVREVTRPVTRAVTETLDRTPVAPVTRAVTDTAGETVQGVVRRVRSTIGSTPVDPVLDVTDGVARDLSGNGAVEPAASGESSTLVDESPSSVTKRAASDTRRAAPVPDPERRAAPPPSTALVDSSSQAVDRADEPAPAPADPTDFAPPCAQSGAASPSAPGAAADQTVAALDLRSAGHPVTTDPLLRVGGPTYEPGCSPD